MMTEQEKFVRGQIGLLKTMKWEEERMNNTHRPEHIYAA